MRYTSRDVSVVTSASLSEVPVQVFSSSWPSKTKVLHMMHVSGIFHFLSQQKCFQLASKVIACDVCLLKKGNLCSSRVFRWSKEFGSHCDTGKNLECIWIAGSYWQTYSISWIHSKSCFSFYLFTYVNMQMLVDGFSLMNPIFLTFSASSCAQSPKGFTSWIFYSIEQKSLTEVYQWVSVKNRWTYHLSFFNQRIDGDNYIWDAEALKSLLLSSTY